MAVLEQEKETPIFILLSVILIFLLINYDPSVSIAYISIAFLNLIIYHNYKRFTFSFSRRVNWIQATGLGIVVTAAFIISMNIIGKIIDPNTITSPFSVIEVMASQLPSPLLSQSIFLTWLSVGLIFAILETDFFFGRMLELLANRFKVSTQFDLSNRKVWILIGMVSAFFSLFHLTAKRANLDVGLMFTFLFGVISCWLVFKNKRTAEAVIFHIVANSTWIFATYGATVLSSIAN